MWSVSRRAVRVYIGKCMVFSLSFLTYSSYKIINMMIDIMHANMYIYIYKNITEYAYTLANAFFFKVFDHLRHRPGKAVG